MLINYARLVWYRRECPLHIEPNNLIKKAVADSRKKAEILAEAAGVRLGPIASINYSWSSLELVSNRMSMDAVPLMAAKTAAPAMNIEPEDIDVSDTVTVIWSIG